MFEDGSIRVGTLDHATATVATADLHAKYERDDHNNPSFLYLPDQRLMVFYSKHCGPDMNARVTARSGDTWAWEAELTLPISAIPRTGAGQWNRPYLTAIPNGKDRYVYDTDFLASVKMDRSARK